METIVFVRPSAAKSLQKAPIQVKAKFQDWVLSINFIGLAETRQVPGWHDEPLKGQRQGQRSIRLNSQWRAIYQVEQNGQITITILEITAHDYRRR